jgi:hypothetical protein
MHFKYKYLTYISLGSLLLLTGCMSSEIEKEIIKTEQSSTSGETGNDDMSSNSVELSDEQKQALENLDKKSNEEALFENDLDIRKEIEIDIPEQKDSFNDPTELSQYISYLFFAFYKGEMQPEQFLDQLLLHAHTEYLDQLPKKRQLQIDTLQLIQNEYREKLRSEFKNFIITELQYQERVDEAFFYRKYVLENSEEIYSVTTLKKEGDSWKLFDDSPSTPYVSIDFIREKQKQ